jgi:inositol phosphorylceramide mannosyltransferase catalytic subunit
MKTVPAIIHQVWLNKDDRAPGVPDKYVPKINRMKSMNPGYEHRLWDTKKANELFQSPVLQRWKTFFERSLVLHIEKCDFLRYAVLYMYGGVYVDVDFDCILPFDTVDMRKREFMWVLDHQYWTHNVKYVGEKPVYNGFLASSPRHPIFKDLMDFIMFSYMPDRLVMCSTGPVAVGKFARIMGLFGRPELWGDRCWILPTDTYGRPDPQCLHKPRLLSQSETFLSSSWMLEGCVPWCKALIKDHHLPLLGLLLIALFWKISRTSR